MVNSGFIQVYNKTVNFYDFHYHLHKSTFKGLGNVLKDYSDYQKQYASNLLKLTAKIKSQIPDLQKEMYAVNNTINDIIELISTMSQLHFNYSQRLKEVSNNVNTQYLSCKKTKAKHMSVIRDQFTQNIQKARESKDRKKIIDQQAQICKTLYNHLDKYSQQQAQRTQKLKQQTLIYLTFTKKIVQKQLQVLTKYKTKVSQQQIQIKNQQISPISQILVQQYNSYFSDQNKGNQQNRISIRKNYDKVQPLQINRDSLRQSTILREKINNLDHFNNKMKQCINKYHQFPDQTSKYKKILQQKNNVLGLIDNTILKKSRLYSNLLKSNTIKQISFDMFCSYLKNNKSSDIKLIINTIKANLKISTPSINQYCKNLQQFKNYSLQQKSSMQIDQKKTSLNKDYIFHLTTILLINQIYWFQQEQFRDLNSQNIVDQNFLMNYFKKRQHNLNKLKYGNKLHIKISSVLIKHLISALIVIRQQENIVLYDFQEYLESIEQFSLEYFQVNISLTKIMFLDVLQNGIRSTKSSSIQKICNQMQLKIRSNQVNIQSHQNYKNQLIASLILKVTDGIINFYSLPIPLINFFQIIFLIQKLSKTNTNFSSVQYYHKCIQKAGYTYIFSIDQQKKIIQPTIWQGQMRLKNLVDTFQKLQYKNIYQNYFIQTAKQMVKLLGVQYKVIFNKMKQQFMQPLCQIIQNNLNLLSKQGGVDKQGYILKLGIYLAQTDLTNYNKNNNFQTKYFQVLEFYLNNTEKQYNSLLQHSRKTQIWVMQENQLATQNCIDFCSLLYKPFQFLLSTLKQLGKDNHTQFTEQFSQFIKNKLNNILKEQIRKYINFLQQSLRIYLNNNQDRDITYKPKKIQFINQKNTEQLNKKKYQFKQVVRRILNINFLKQQLNQIINDFLDQDITNDLKGSIFNLQNLGSAILKYKPYKQILNNLKDIVICIQSIQQKIIYKISDITISYFMKTIFNNLYYQQQKSTFDQFFGTKQDYKLSQYTLVKYQKQIQQIFIMIDKFIPYDIIDKFNQRLIIKFYDALKYQILNPIKFKMPKTREIIVRYLDDDTTFICTLLKQKYINPKIIQDKLEKPLHKLYQQYKLSTKDLMQQFQNQTLKGNNQQCKYILIMLYLRSNDEKAQDFFKKYKSTVFK